MWLPFCASLLLPLLSKLGSRSRQITLPSHTTLIKYITIAKRCSSYIQGFLLWPMSLTLFLYCMACKPKTDLRNKHQYKFWLIRCHPASTYRSPSATANDQKKDGHLNLLKQTCFQDVRCNKNVGLWSDVSIDFLCPAHLCPSFSISFFVKVIGEASE